MLVFGPLSPVMAPAAAAEDIFGSWLRTDGAVRIRVAPCGGAICSTNIWVRDPKGQDEYVGDQLVFKVTRTGDGWSGSGTYPKHRLNYSAVLKATATSLTSTGCTAGGLLCRTTRWTRE